MNDADTLDEFRYKKSQPPSEARMKRLKGSSQLSYKHTQRAPLCILLYTLALLFMLLGWFLRGEQPFPWLFPPIGVLMLILAASFHHLAVEDEGDRLSVRFGPLPLFRRAIRYSDIVGVECGRTTLLDGWGIHLSVRGGWVWNLWGRDCVVLRLQRGTLRVGTDDAEELVAFVQSRLERPRICSRIVHEQSECDNGPG